MAARTAWAASAPTRATSHRVSSRPSSNSVGAPGLTPSMLNSSEFVMSSGRLLCHRAIRSSQIAFVVALGFPMTTVVRDHQPILSTQNPTRSTGRTLAHITEPSAVRAILAHLRLPSTARPIAPAGAGTSATNVATPPRAPCNSGVGDWLGPRSRRYVLAAG